MKRVILCSPSGPIIATVTYEHKAETIEGDFLYWTLSTNDNAPLLPSLTCSAFKNFPALLVIKKVKNIYVIIGLKTNIRKLRFSVMICTSYFTFMCIKSKNGDKICNVIEFL